MKKKLYKKETTLDDVAKLLEEGFKRMHQKFDAINRKMIRIARPKINRKIKNSK